LPSRGRAHAAEGGAQSVSLSRNTSSASDLSDSGSDSDSESDSYSDSDSEEQLQGQQEEGGQQEQQQQEDDEEDEEEDEGEEEEEDDDSMWNGVDETPFWNDAAESELYGEGGSEDGVTPAHARARQRLSNGSIGSNGSNGSSGSLKAAPTALWVCDPCGKHFRSASGAATHRKYCKATALCGNGSLVALQCFQAKAALYCEAKAAGEGGEGGEGGDEGEGGYSGRGFARAVQFESGEGGQGGRRTPPKRAVGEPLERAGGEPLGKRLPQGHGNTIGGDDAAARKVGR
jgi:hypothetical protein